MSDVITEVYTEMNIYFENILNSPSTINRVIKYYTVGVPDSSMIFKRYIMFNGVVVKIYFIKRSK